MIPHLATYRAIIVRYPMKKTSTKEFGDTIAAGIARYEKYRCWGKRNFLQKWGARRGQEDTDTIRSRRDGDYVSEDTESSSQCFSSNEVMRVSLSPAHLFEKDEDKTADPAAACKTGCGPTDLSQSHTPI